MSHGKQASGLLALGALGVVYGDIGTSPLYALRETFHEAHNIAVSPVNVLGVLSLIFWSLIIVISIKYLVFIVRADNAGEGGVLALTALITPMTSKLKSPLVMLGLFGTALLYGDGMITPAISVLSAVEGLEFVTPIFHPYIIPITVVIIIGLFSIQKHGTATVGKIFGPITLLWFIILAILGVRQIIELPSVLASMNPHYAYKFFAENSWHGFVVLGSVFLVVTGGEALYSDLGHFGKTPIRYAWFSVVLPCLLLNYFGQGALLIRHPEAIKNPFYLLAPDWGLIPLVILATISTVIASQALITGVFSLTMQAVQLQYSPRVNIHHTSQSEFGQIYIASVNWILMLACIALVLFFQTSSNLAAAYGIAVTTTMVITTILFYFVARHNWRWTRLAAASVCGFFLIIETAFWAGNVLKIVHGGWFPLLVGGGIFFLMTTWNKGRQILQSRMLSIIKPLPEFIKEITAAPPLRVPGTAIYMSGNPDFVPATLILSFEHFKSLHEHLIFLNVKTEQTPHVPIHERVSIIDVAPNMYRIFVHYGFMDLPDIPNALQGMRINEFVFDPIESTYFIGKEHIIATKRPGMALWRERIFSLMSRNSQPATAFFQLPASHVIEIGTHVEI
jgi:KUP system potassium uptake protein